MRKISLLGTIILCVQICFGQGQIGLKAGVNFNHINAKSSGLSFRSINTGYTFGATVDLRVSDNFFIQPELNYSYLTLHESFYSVDWRYSYFNIPVLLKYKFSKSPIGIYIGPQLGFLTKATSKTKTASTDIKSDLTNTDFSGVAGIDYKFDNGLRLDLRFQQSAFDLAKVEYANPADTKAMVFSFTVGYVFKNAKKN
jgi:opacity protein-like surface antigen